MPLIANSAVALPYIDTQPSAEALAAVHVLIEAELQPEHAITLHPSIHAPRASNFSELINSEHERIASDTSKTSGIDLTRYEAADPPTDGDKSGWKTNLKRAYISAKYLRAREVNLSLLETYGKNAWLVGNSQLEDILRDLEKELENARLELEEIEQARRISQENASGELRSLEEGWRNGVGRMIETQAAAEGLRRQILDKRREITA